MVLTKEIAYQEITSFFQKNPTPLVVFGPGTSCTFDWRFGMGKLKEDLIDKLPFKGKANLQKKWKDVINALDAKIEGFDHSSEVVQRSKQLDNNHLTIGLSDQNIPADTGYYHRFFHISYLRCKNRQQPTSGDTQLTACEFASVYAFIYLSGNQISQRLTPSTAYNINVSCKACFCNILTANAQARVWPPIPSTFPSQASICIFPLLFVFNNFKLY